MLSSISKPYFAKIMSKPILPFSLTRSLRSFPSMAKYFSVDILLLSSVITVNDKSLADHKIFKLSNLFLVFQLFSPFLKLFENHIVLLLLLFLF